VRNYRAAVLTEKGQKAPVFQARDEWPRALAILYGILLYSNHEETHDDLAR